MALFDVTVLVRLAGLDSPTDQTVVPQKCLVPRGEFLWMIQLVHRGRKAIRSVLGRNASQLEHASTKG